MLRPCESEAVRRRLLRDFVGAARGAGAGAAATEVEGAGMDLLRRWSEPHRGYHDVRHLTEVLERLDELAADGVPAARAPAVLLAAWFHDAVYEGRPGDDELASAVLAREELGALGVPTAAAGRVHDLVLVTASHEPEPEDFAAQALCDADLAILAADPERYADYVSGVRREYAHVDDAVFATGRAHVLGELLDTSTLFATTAGRSRWEERARANVAAELTVLSS